jgi:hypothetical protein
VDRPGSHTDVRVPGRATRTGEERGGLGTGLTLQEVYPEVVAERRAAAPPVRSTIRKGAVAIRDVRLWHRGMPSEGRLPRHMLALVYTAAALHPDADRPAPVGGGRRYTSFNPAALVFSDSVWARPDNGVQSALAFPTVSRFSMALWHGRTGRLIAKNGGF